MDRARRAGLTALIVVAMVASVGGSRGSGVLAGVVAWPPSTLVVSEVQTGGTSASDEFVEIADQGSAPVDLLGIEVIYVTSSGSTVTRKTTWATSTILDPGRRFLLGNSAGIFGPISDATYAGGFAATGGAIAIRVVGGAVIDAVAWGDATNAFVEGTATPAPAAGSSLERGPGGSAGNGTDTNDNAHDWFLQPMPSPQGLGRAAHPGTGIAEPHADRSAEHQPKCEPQSDPDPDRHADRGCDAFTEPDPDRDPTPTTTPPRRPRPRPPRRPRPRPPRRPRP